MQYHIFYIFTTTSYFIFYSQIRLMIGAAVLITRDIIPESALDLALLSPYFINLPMAPAEGLILVNAGFERNSNGQVNMKKYKMIDCSISVYIIIII